MRNSISAILLAFALSACAPGLGAPSTVFPTFTPVSLTTPVPPTATVTPTPTSSTTATSAPTITWTPSPRPTATSHPCWDEGGRMTSHTLATDLSPLPWEFRVYTPPCYDENPEQQYPLLILIHGSTYTDSQWDDLGADEMADQLIASSEAPPFIILMPRDRVWVEPAEDPFGEAVVTRILPWVDQNYRTIPDRPYRAIGGLSRGASWSVHLGLKYAGLFSAIGGHSLPVFLTDPSRIRVWLDQIPAELLPRIYLDIGRGDYLLDKALWFEELLTELNIPHEWHLNLGRHEDAYWSAHMEAYLRWYTEEW